MSRRVWSTSVALALPFALTSLAFTFYAISDPGEGMTQAAQAFLETLDAEQKQTVVLDYDTPKRTDWHFIPKDERKGLQLKHMNDAQRKAAHALLKSALSEMGYNKSTKIMALEKLLNEFEEGKGRFLRDHERYYFTVFGDVTPDSKWGLSVEGHHLSLNFVVDGNRVVSSTPQVFCTNPALVKNENKSGIEVGTRVLAKEETLAFDLVNSLTDEQKQVAIIAEKAPSEVRAAGEPQPPTAAAEGIRYEDLNGDQRNLLLSLVNEYANAMPDRVARQRVDKIHFDGLNDVHFAWAGATEPGIGHYYKIQAPSFLIEFVNTQPDAAGNPANHIHCIWRDMHGDF
ncbi:MAG: DUF3500 domain-containing protein, partial [Planctomycetaceae bacterium]|nr:DUF3500 domain-containing protein [Planctomycetaceae bacterium]